MNNLINNFKCKLDSFRAEDTIIFSSKLRQLIQNESYFTTKVVDGVDFRSIS